MLGCLREHGVGSAQIGGDDAVEGRQIAVGDLAHRHHASGVHDHIDRVLAEVGRDAFVTGWLKTRGEGYEAAFENEAIVRAAIDHSHVKPDAVISDASEIALMRRLALYPRLVEAAALAHEPHRIAFYLYEVAGEFHALWNKGSDAPYLRFIIENDPLLTVARLALVQGVVTVLASGLELLGVEAPEEMR